MLSHLLSHLLSHVLSHLLSHLSACALSRHRRAPQAYEKAQVVDLISPTKVKVQLPGAGVEEYALSDLLPCNTDSNLDDVCALTYLSEAAVLDCVRERFLLKKIYTWVARILIAMNPFERLDIYDDTVKAEYAKLDHALA